MQHAVAGRPTGGIAPGPEIAVIGLREITDSVLHPADIIRVTAPGGFKRHPFEPGGLVAVTEHQKALRIHTAKQPVDGVKSQRDVTRSLFIRPAAGFAGKRRLRQLHSGDTIRLAGMIAHDRCKYNADRRKETEKNA